MGEQLARFHLAGQDFDMYRDNDRGLNWMQTTLDQLKEKLASDEIELITKELSYQAKFNWAKLPQGIIHADLFCDNALFDGDKLSGIIDLYYACNYSLLYDLAVMVNDWCREQTKPNSELGFKFNPKKIAKMLESYQQIRPLTDAEQQTWQAALRLAGLRFFLSRLKDQHLPREGEITQIKNPSIYKKILQIHQGSSD
jgi:homoserine kinase type II